MKVNILCIGDVVGKPGRNVLAEKLAGIVSSHSIDCVVVNAENAAGGSGLTEKIYNKLMRYGTNIITLGDHIFKKREIIPILERSNNILKPANLSEHASGRTYALYRTGKGPVVGVATLLGRVFMKPANCPFEAIDRLLPKLKNEADIIVVEVHAEATSEKTALGYYLDGKVSLVFGSHTHVQTADERILPGGTGYITDIGMTGPHQSVLGRNSDNVVKAMRTQMPYKYDVATDDARISGIIVTIDSNTKQTEMIRRIQVKADTHNGAAYDSDDGKPEPNGFFY
ncbi:metallophosphoesterase, MG_246/ family [Limihaloglobus sulfuriphilus]|uniref:Metallophosphoesterase, MG_246/ family n=1 Tax=Limihaloglobus sulfuriphilus TaxID=1851148 RepID=A0A1Q2MGF9_9BACT|nr:TIGR00282 family metallophosphoesterase [Limihaloglobus sulfuriphilus]AQQ71771.1 metallophosphoesterase, MG_246/ family [Limihaloglobus sulfuriphilus]